MKELIEMLFICVIVAFGSMAIMLLAEGFK